MRDARRPRAASTVIKRSVVIAGHATSISLEEAFWDALKLVATERQVSVASLVSQIDGIRQDPNLSSAIRVFVLTHYREGLAASRADARPDLGSVPTGSERVLDIGACGGR